MGVKATGAGRTKQYSKSIGLRAAIGLILGVVIGSGIFSSPGLVTTVSLYKCTRSPYDSHFLRLSCYVVFAPKILNVLSWGGRKYFKVLLAGSRVGVGVHEEEDTHMSIS